jgi:hypothetical protein
MAPQSRSMSPGAWWLGAALLIAVTLAGSPAAHATWGTLAMRVPPRTPPEQSWLKDLPERPGAHTRGKVAVFEFKGDDVYQPVREAVVRLLRRRGFTVTVTLRRVESATEYRDMSHAANMAVYVDGEMKGEGERQSAVIRLYSGLSGGRMTSVRFAGPTNKIVGDVEHTFWTRVGPAITRVCTAVAKPRRLEHEPLHIDASDPID